MDRRALQQFLRNLPVDDEPVTKADVRAIAEARADAAAGRVVSTEELCDELDLELVDDD